MSQTISSPAPVAAPPQRRAPLVHAAIEGLVLLLVCLAPWPFGSVHPLFEFVLLASVALLLVLWSAAILVEGQFSWKRCPVAPCLAGLVLVGVGQLVPLPAEVLRWFSPSSVQLLQQLRPATHEQLISGEPCESGLLAAGSTLSLYPGGTRLALLRFLAVFLLFVVVRHTIASKESLRRLSFVCMVNGAALALFALLQFFTTERHVIFWVYETGGTVFGTFINRNHFAFYMNICVCLTGGLLAGYWLGRRDTYDLPWSAPLQHPPSLWLSAFLLLMFTSLAFCLSRGGLLALFFGCMTAVAVRWVNASRRSWQEPAWAAVILTSAGLLVWYALPSVETRLARLWHGNVQEGRLAVWVTALTIGRDYPLLGSGNGSFGFLELSRRTFGDEPRKLYANAHNDYLEALAEGGVMRLLLSLAAIVLVYVLAMRAYRRYRAHPAGGWVLGATAAFTTFVVHSFFDFGLHVPAIAFLATVVAAQLAALGARRTPDNRPMEYTLRLFGLAPLAAAAVLLVLAGTLASEGWRLSQAERFRKAAEHRDVDPVIGKESHAPQVEYLEKAIRYSPEDASLRLDLAEAHLWQAEHTSEPGHRAAAARQLLAARDLCPVMVQPQLKLAALTDEFSSPDSAGVYLERATLLGPTDPQLWHLRGAGELAAGHTEKAWQCWRRSLELSDFFLPDILHRLGDKPDPEAVAEKLLPDKAEMLVEAARQLYPDEADLESQRPFLLRAVRLLQERTGSQGKDLYLRGRIQAGLGERAAAIESYRLALARDGSQTLWRLELAKLLIENGNRKDAEQELQRVEREQPNQPEAKDLLETLKHELK